MSSWDIFYRSFIEKEGYKDVLKGLGATVQIAVFGLLIGVLIGTIIAVSKVVKSDNIFIKIWRKFNDIYIWIFRGTPMVVQLLIIYYVLLSSIKPNTVWVAVVVFGMNSGAYVSEIMRAGIQSVDGGQMEAGRSLGLSYSRTMFSVVLPQSFKNILPTLGNEFITLVKETSVVSFIAVTDLTKAFKSIGDGTYEYVIPYLMLAACYLIIVSLITVAVKAMERRMKRSDKQQS